MIAGRDVGAAEAFLRELPVMVAAASREQARRAGLLPEQTLAPLTVAAGPHVPATLLRVPAVIMQLN